MRFDLARPSSSVAFRIAFSMSFLDMTERPRMSRSRAHCFSVFFAGPPLVTFFLTFSQGSASLRLAFALASSVSSATRERRPGSSP